MLTDGEQYFLSLVQQGKLVIDYELGLVYSKLTGKTKTVGAKQSAGYLHISAGPSRQERNYILLHRLIWIARYGEIPDGYEINHKNGTKIDNRLENLELLTRTENTRHAAKELIKKFGFALRKSSGNKRTPKNKIEEVLSLFDSGQKNQSEIARQTGVKRPIVNRLLHKHRL